MPTENDNKLYLLLGEMSGDIKNVLAKSNDQDTRLNAHGGRLTAVERFQWKLLGAATAVPVAVGLAVKFI